jgi:hypothetical protein
MSVGSFGGIILLYRYSICTSAGMNQPLNCESPRGPAPHPRLIPASSPPRPSAEGSQTKRWCGICAWVGFGRRRQEAAGGGRRRGEEPSTDETAKFDGKDRVIVTCQPRNVQSSSQVKGRQLFTVSPPLIDLLFFARPRRVNAFSLPGDDVVREMPEISRNWRNYRPRLSAEAIDRSDPYPYPYPYPYYHSSLISPPFHWTRAESTLGRNLSTDPR